MTLQMHGEKQITKWESILKSQAIKKEKEKAIDKIQDKKREKNYFELIQTPMEFDVIFLN